MADPFISEIRMIGFDFAPLGWAFCDGQILAINQNQALFSLLGTMYGGNGQTTFGLPNLQGSAAIGFSQSYKQGQRGGEMIHALTPQEMPTHNHMLSASSAQGNNPVSSGAVLGSPLNLTYRTLPDNELKPMASASLATKGGGQPHTNMQPYLVLNFCIALKGAYPSER